MEIGTKTKEVISKGGKIMVNGISKPAQEVVYKTAAYRIKGVMKFISQTRHEVI